MRQIYQQVEEIVNKVKFDEIWPKFKPYPFVLYNKKEVYFKDKVIPWDERFLGNSIIEYDQKMIVIWKLVSEEVESFETLAANLVHEMFHIFQVEHGEERYPDEFLLLKPVIDVYFYQLKQYELQLLKQSFKGSEVNLQDFQTYLTIKRYRQNQYPDDIQQELFTETLEGMAEFAGMKALKQLSEELYSKALKQHLTYISEQQNLFQRRRLAYSVGALQLVATEQLGGQIEHELECQTISVFDQLMPEIKAEQPCFPEDSSMKQRLISIHTQRHQVIQQFLNQNVNQIEALGKIVGYDPMNMFILGNQLYCSHFIKLMIDLEERYIEGPVLLDLVDPVYRYISAYYLPK